MRGSVAPVVVCLLVAAPLAFAQQGPAASIEAVAGAPAQAAKAADVVANLPDRELLTRILEGWSSLNPDNVVRFYDQASPFPFYDVAPLKYDSFPAYVAGVKELASTLSSLNFTVNQDLVVRPAGAGWAVSTVTLHMRMAPKTGDPTELDGRWTVVWQKKGAGWMIVHDHFSAPYPM